MNSVTNINAALQKHAESFRGVKARDLADRPDWRSNWLFEKEYQIYKSPQDFIRWLEWFRPEDCRAHYLSEESVTVLADESEGHSRRIFAPLLSSGYKYRHVDEYNAVDYILQNFYPVPARMRPKRVLDFGAGYGRQMNLWSRVADLTYVAVDAVELPYTLQSFYYTQFSMPVYEYATGYNEIVGSKPGIYHIPTWRTDLLPEAFFDLVICTQVMQEISTSMLETALLMFKRCVKPGGAVYIRDHGLATQGMHNVDVDAALLKNGFVMEFCPYVLDTPWNEKPGYIPDLHGIPRLFRRIDPRYPVCRPRAKESSKVRQKISRVIGKVDNRCGGFLRRILNK